MDAFTPQILADGGSWAESEVLGQRAVVKARASAQTLTAIAQAAGFTRIPVAALDDPLASLTTGQKTALRQLVLDMGYTAAEIRGALGDDLGQRTLGELLRFVASRRRKVRYDAQSDTIVDDGPEVTPVSIDSVDRMVS